MSNYKLQNMMKLLPYKLKKRINKTAEGRSGNEIYKRRNRRDYRVVMQYTTWKKIIDCGNSDQFFEKFEEGYVVSINPEDYFGNNYPNPSNVLDSNFKLGETGFVLYTVLSDYSKYPPLANWEEVYELSTKGKPKQVDDTWSGEYVLNVKNGNCISPICDTNRNSKKTKEIQQYVKDKFNLAVDIKDIPKQAGLGNYDYDYANSETMENVKYQMLYLVLTCKSHKGESFPEYICNNFADIQDRKDTSAFEKMVQNSRKYISTFNREFDLFSKECKRRNLLNFEELQELGVWSIKNSNPICPLCHKPLYVDEFFDDIKQMEGRQVIDNTQKSIVLMHVDALRPGKFNHRHYNLGWGHNYCNLIQGDKDISETIEVLKEIFESHHINF